MQMLHRAAGAHRGAVDASRRVGQRRKCAGRLAGHGRAGCAGPPVAWDACHTRAPGAAVAHRRALQNPVRAHRQSTGHTHCTHHLHAKHARRQAAGMSACCMTAVAAFEQGPPAEHRLLRTCQAAQQQRTRAALRRWRMNKQPHARPATKAGATKKLSRRGSRPNKANWAVTPSSTTTVAGRLRYCRQFTAWSAQAAPARHRARHRSISTLALPEVGQTGSQTNMRRDAAGTAMQRVRTYQADHTQQPGRRRRWSRQRGWQTPQRPPARRPHTAPARTLPARQSPAPGTCQTSTGW